MIRILYVDDEPELLEICKLILEGSGDFQVDTVLLVEEALERLTSTIYDAIISDYQMPSMNGLSFLKKLRSHGDSTPFILFTGRGREEVIIEALNNGADFYLQKGGDSDAQFAELEHKIRLIVEQRRIKTDLIESQRRVADIIDFLPDATFAIDLEGRVIAWNRAIEELTGVSKETILGTGNYSYSLPFYRERHPILIDLVLRENREVEESYLHVKKTGNKIIADIDTRRLHGKEDTCLWGVASPLYDTKDNIVGAIESIRDITDRRKIEIALAESERKYRNIVEDQTEFISRFLPDGTHIFVNEAYCRYFNKSRDEIIGKKFIPLIPVEDRLLVRRHFASLSPESPVDLIEHRIIMPDGSTRWQRWSDRAIFDPAGNVIEYQSVGRDFTEIKQVEEALRREKVFSDAVIASIPGAFFVVDRSGGYVRCNKFMEETLGIPADRLIGTSALLPVLEEDRPTVEGAKEEVFLNGDAGIRAQVIGKRKLIREYLITGRRMTVGDEEYIIGTGIDMTEKYQSLRAIEESEKRYRTLFNCTGTAMFILEEDTTVSLVNAEFEKMSGYTKEEVEGKKSWTELVVPEDAVWMKEFHIRRRQNDGTDVPRNYEFRFITREGCILIMYLSIDLIPGTKQTIVSLVDITERKQLEEKLRITNGTPIS